MLSLLKRIYYSISFIPSLMSFFFAVFAILLIAFPEIWEGVSFLNYIRVRDIKVVQFILTFVIGGVFTVTIFSFTMVMTVLNRSISTYSPRLIPLLLSQRNHQVILGFSCGTLIFSIILSLFVGNSKPFKFPGLGSFFAIVFAIVCVINFIYFIHGVSQSIHINHILERSYKHIKGNIDDLKALETNFTRLDAVETPFSYGLKKSGYFQKFEIEKLGKIAHIHDLDIQVEKEMGMFILENEHFFSTSKELDDDLKRKITGCFSIDKSEAMQVPVVGMKHLVEVAVKACSPSINDPATANSAIDYLTQVLIKNTELKPFNAYQKEPQGRAFFFSLMPVEKFIVYSYFEMYTYMKDDALMVKKLKWSLNKLRGETSQRLPSDEQIFAKAFD